MQVNYEEVVDRMVGQLLRLLWQAERAGRGRYSLVVTGDHSTPVEFGDHSHEPVPFAIARVRDVVSGEPCQRLNARGLIQRFPEKQGRVKDVV